MLIWDSPRILFLIFVVKALFLLLFLCVCCHHKWQLSMFCMFYCFTICKWNRWHVCVVVSQDGFLCTYESVKEGDTKDKETTSSAFHKQFCIYQGSIFFSTFLTLSQISDIFQGCQRVQLQLESFLWNRYTYLKYYRAKCEKMEHSWLLVKQAERNVYVNFDHRERKDKCFRAIDMYSKLAKWSMVSYRHRCGWSLANKSVTIPTLLPVEWDLISVCEHVQILEKNYSVLLFLYNNILLRIPKGAEISLLMWLNVFYHQWYFFA